MAALDQHDAQVLLELPDVLRDRGLGDLQPRGGIPQAVGFGQADEAAQKGEVQYRR